MGMADIAEVLWNDYLKHNPANPRWPNRDRFVLSNGHGSMLLYSLLHLTGYDVSIDELRNFRQFGERTAGHPEYEPEMGVETTTGPLGQGVSNAVGMALAEKMLAAEFNREGFPVVDHRSWVFVGDGCLMEGISHEACSLAGTLKLGKLIAFYDDNDISIDGNVGGWFTDDTPARFESYGWQVIRDVDGHDSAAIAAAVDRATELVRRLLTFSRKVEHEFQPLDLNQEVVQTVKILERTIPKMIGIETDLGPDLTLVQGDRTQLEQILMNLGANAKDAMPQGGRLDIQTSNVTLDEEYCREHTEFGQRVVNSCLTLAFMVGISVNDTTQGTTVANLGWDEVRFPKPLFHGDTIHVQSEVLELRESKSRPHNGIVILAHRAYNQHDELVGECKRTALMLKRPK